MASRDFPHNSCIAIGLSGEQAGKPRTQSSSEGLPLLHERPFQGKIDRIQLTDQSLCEIVDPDDNRIVAVNKGPAMPGMKVSLDDRRAEFPVIAGEAGATFSFSRGRLTMSRITSTRRVSIARMTVMVISFYVLTRK